MISAAPPNAMTRWPAAHRSRPTAFARTGSARCEVSSPLQPEHRRDDVERGDHAEHADHRGEERVRETGLAAHPLDDLARLPVVADEIRRALRHPAERDAGDEEPGAPARARCRAAAARPARPPCRAGPRRVRAGSAGSSSRCRAALRAPYATAPCAATRRHEQEQHPPAFVRERPCVLQPAERRQPGQYR